MLMAFSKLRVLSGTCRGQVFGTMVSGRWIKGIQANKACVIILCDHLLWACACLGMKTTSERLITSLQHRFPEKVLILHVEASCHDLVTAERVGQGLSELGQGLLPRTSSVPCCFSLANCQAKLQLLQQVPRQLHGL